MVINVNVVVIGVGGRGGGVSAQRERALHYPAGGAERAARQPIGHVRGQLQTLQRGQVLN